MKKLITFAISFAMVACLFPLSVLHAEDKPPYSDTSYWGTYCSDDANSSSDACDAYRNYLKDQKADLAQQLEDAKAKAKEYAANADQYRDTVANLQTDINALQTQIQDVQAKIDELQTQIDAKQKEIDAKQAEIDATQKKIDTISEKIKARMVTKQSSLRIDKYLDILAGASSLEDWLRIMSGLQAISDSDKNTNDTLVSLRTQQDTQKKELVTAQDAIKASQNEQQGQKDSLSAAQDQLLVKKAEAQSAAEAADLLSDQMIAQSDNISNNMTAIRDALKQVSADNYPDVSYGWTFPVPGSYKSAGTWTYPDSDILHCGYDFASPNGATGMPVLAAANGLIINSANGCGYGYLGNWCGAQQGGLAGAGNQVYELAIVNDGLYEISYFHLLINTPVATGTVVYAGDQIGLMGSSGNSTGPHTHIEVTYLGDASTFQSWLDNWSGDLSFGMGWNKWGRRCDLGDGAPCRLRPESVFGEG